MIDHPRLFWWRLRNFFVRKCLRYMRIKICARKKFNCVTLVFFEWNTMMLRKSLWQNKKNASPGVSIHWSLFDKLSKSFSTQFDAKVSCHWLFVLQLQFSSSRLFDSLPWKWQAQVSTWPQKINRRQCMKCTLMKFFFCESSSSSIFDSVAFLTSEQVWKEHKQNFF